MDHEGRKQARRCIQEWRFIEVIAREHGRTLTAIEARLQKPGLITEAERTTRQMFVAQRAGYSYGEIASAFAVKERTRETCVGGNLDAARHSSVSWNLMVGENPPWVAKQHGHSVQTMLEV